jgi:hypothetical protein
MGNNKKSNVRNNVRVDQINGYEDRSSFKSWNTPPDLASSAWPETRWIPALPLPKLPPKSICLLSDFQAACQITNEDRYIMVGNLNLRVNIGDRMLSADIK